MIEATVKSACKEANIDVDVSTSIGAAFYPADGDTAEDLLRIADRRMYSHKRRHYEALDRQASLPLTLAATA